VGRNEQDDELQRRFARNLRAARQRAKLTQADTAARLRISEEAYSRYERAKIWPSLGNLRDLCRVFDCSADSLLGLDGSPSRPAPPPPPDDNPPAVRRLLRALRKARPRTVRIVTAVLREREKVAVASKAGRGEDGEGGEGGGAP
jgi:transcriptional regulator with XRE-family HTH domain